MLLPNPWVLIGFLAVLGLTGWRAYEHGLDTADGRAAKAKALAVEVREAARQGAADEIAKMKVVNTTIRQRAETVIHEKPVYRECAHDPSVLRNINAALTGRAEPATDGVVPGAGASH